MGFNGNLEAAKRTSEIVLTTLNPEDKVTWIWLTRYAVKSSPS